MNKDEIKKALEICSKDEDCEKCPYCDHYRCDRALQKDSFVLITEQEQEIERLKAENYELTKKLEARLTCDFVKTAQKQAQIDILNKAKERIGNAIDTYYNSYGGGYFIAEDALDDIDELIEEVEE